MKRNITFAAVILIIMSGFFFANYRIAEEKVLVIHSVEQNTEIIIPVPDRNFTVGFLHSVHKTPVCETFFIEDDNRLTLKDTRYSSLGVGMPYTDEGGAFINDDGEFVLYFDRTYDFIPIRLSPIPEHSIEVGGETYQLLDFAKPNDRIDISATDKWSLKTISRKER